MSRTLGIVALLWAMVATASAADKPGSITGLVRDSSGTAQMGAAVEVLAGASALLVFTDAKGRFSVSDLAPGTYQVRASAPSFLPALRENVSLTPGAHLIVNLTLNTLFEAAQFLPSRPRIADDNDDWKWILRSAANRPILRVLDGAPVLVSENDPAGDRGLTGQVVLVGGSEAEGFGAPAVGTAFRVEHSLFSAGRLSLNGNLGYGDGVSAVVRAAYRHHFENGAHPEFGLTVRRFASPTTIVPGGAVEALAFSVADSTVLNDFIELNYGGEFQTVQFGERVSTFRPFGSVAVLVRPGTLVQYHYATAAPDMRAAKGFDSAPADLSEAGPRMSLVNAQPRLERAQHHEVSISQRLGRNSLQFAAYSDTVSNAALVGVGEVSAEQTGLLPDVYSGTFSYNGGTLSTNGVRLVYARKLASQLTVTADYAFGGVLDLDPESEWTGDGQGYRTVRRHSVAGKLVGSVPGAKTRWIASYKWTSGDALTPVDLFNASPGQTDPFLNVFVRQPLPAYSFLPGRMEALLDLRNLLAQGYIPVLAGDGQTVYLVQSARSVRGGLAFTF